MPTSILGPGRPAQAPPTFGTLQAVCTALGLTLAEVIVFGSDPS
ncbi:MAG TPA: hypothetical protein VFD01_12935 [Candidatus Dormibacteraeota bacterium]|nr:hypothetical protein [Candidatus Dormibacteraeota bacterium]